MNQNPVFMKALHRFAVFAAVSTFFLIFAGGLVTSTNSGLAVPDWPLSYGQIMPPMVGGIFYEHGHRMVATFVGMLTVVLAVWLWKKEPRKWVRILGVAALGAVIVQGILGGLTVLYLLPTAISVSHATLAQSFFCTVSALALFTSRWWHSEQPQLSPDGRPGLMMLSLLLVGSIFVQLILGAVMRHTQSGLAVPDFPLAYGFLAPPLDSQSLDQYNLLLRKADIRIFADGPITTGQVVVHLLHRYWALVVTGLSAWTVIKAFKSNRSRLKLMAGLFAVLLTVQIGLGAFTVLLRKDVLVTTAHVANGALLLCLSVLLMLHVGRLRHLSFTPRAVPLQSSEALA